MNNLLINDMIIQMQEIHQIGHSLHYFCGWVGGWLENWRVMLISAFNYVIVEVVAEIGKIYNYFTLQDTLGNCTNTYWETEQ